MCSGRVDLAFILRAFSNGADGVYIGGCWPGECHYVTEGNYDALFNMYFGRKLLEQVGLNPKRLRLEWTASSEGTRYAEVMNDFGGQLKELGPIGAGEGEGFDEAILGLKLEAVTNLVPYLKLVESERLRVRFKTAEEYSEYFDSDDFARLFEQLVADKLAISQITLLLQQDNLSANEVAAALGLDSADASRHLKMSTELGLVRFDEGHKSYALT